MKILIKENQLSNLSQELINSDKINEFKIKWDNLTEEDKYFAKNILDTFYPNHYGQINEAWWNTIGDVIGIFDPTGIVDFVNGIDYIRQGEYFFGFLSMVAIVPFFGDMVAKPITAFAKTGRMKTVVNTALGNVIEGNNAAAVKSLTEVAKEYPKFMKFTRTAALWGVKLKKIVNDIYKVLPGGKLTSGLKNVIDRWIDIFINSAKSISGSRRIVGKLAKEIEKMPKIDTKELVKVTDGLREKYTSLLGRNVKSLTNSQIKNASFMSKYVWPGLIARKGETRILIGLMRKTKFYAGLLDYIGIGNFVGPEELVNQIGEDELNKQFQNYTKTPEAQQYYNEDMSSLPEDNAQPSSQPQQSQQTTTQTQGSNPLSDFLAKQILGPIV